MSNEELYEKAKQAIDDLFGDRSVSISTCKENLRTLQGEIDIMLEALENDESGDE